ncbi:MAG TPA: DUF6510 family protein [Trebonia sp.]|jgi:hypothetical protein|nr:DUF6510 family protein [Trebonia sp.]
METLDGNAIAGLLYEIFGEEMTAATAICESCGSAASVADSVVYLRLPGVVVRCRNCAGLQMVITRVHGLNCVDLSGIAVLEPPGNTP